MKINDDTIRQLRRVQAQKNLPVHPDSLETDAVTQHYADAETEELPGAEKERQAELWRRFTERADRLGVTGTVRSDARKAVQSEPDSDGRLMLAWAIIACVFAVGLAVGLMIAGAFLWRHL